jgi:hypothetical protein
MERNLKAMKIAMPELLDQLTRLKIEEATPDAELPINHLLIDAAGFLQFAAEPVSLYETCALAKQLKAVANLDESSLLQRINQLAHQRLEVEFYGPLHTEGLYTTD